MFGVSTRSAEKHNSKVPDDTNQKAESPITAMSDCTTMR